MSSQATTTTLQQLQALEHDHPSFAGQVHRLSEILSLRCDESTLQKNSSIYSGGRGRLDWGLKWLLGKLGAGTAPGVQARQNTKVWILLNNIICANHPLQSARVLSSTKIISIIQRSLSENFSKEKQDEVKRSDVEINQDSGHDTVSETRSKGESTKKRKRKDIIEPNAVRSKRRAVDKLEQSSQCNDSTNPSSRRSLFSAISTFTAKLVDIAKNQDGVLDHYACEYMHAALIAEASEALILLKDWLSALYWTLDDPPIEGSTAYKADLLRMCHLSSPLYIWATRSGKRDNSRNTDPVSFAIATLVPATKLLYQFKSVIEKQSQDNDIVLHMQVERSSVERVLAENIFVPAKRTFDDAQRNSSSTSVQTQEIETLADIMHALRDSMSPRKDASVVDPRATALLFDIAIRCSPVSGTRRRPRESAWLQAVLTALTSCLGFELAKSTDLELPEANYNAFEELLNMAARSKVTLSGQLLEHIARKISCLESYKSQVVRWGIVSQALASDSTIFLAPISATVESTIESQHLGELIFSAISLDPSSWHSYNHVNVSDRNPLDGSTSIYSKILRGVLLPLLKTYATSRNLASFFTRWHAQLMTTLELRTRKQSLDTEIAYSIWEDSGINNALEQYLGTSFTANQLLEFLASYEPDLETGNAHQKDPMHSWKTASSACILKAVIGGLHDDILENGISSLVINVLQKCHKSLDARENSHVITRSKVWQLVATCHKFLYDRSDFDTLMTLQSISESFFISAIEAIGAIGHNPTDTGEEGLPALACLGSLSEDFKTRHIGFPKACTAAFIKYFPVNDKLNVNHSILSTCSDIVSEYPSLLSLLYATRSVETSFATILLRLSDAERMHRCRSTMSRLLKDDNANVTEILHKLIDTNANDVTTIRDKDEQETRTASLLEGSLQIPINAIDPRMKKTLREICFQDVNRSEISPVSWCHRLGVLLHLQKQSPESPSVNLDIAQLVRIASSVDEALEDASISISDGISMHTLFTELVARFMSNHRPKQAGGLWNDCMRAGLDTQTRLGPATLHLLVTLSNTRGVREKPETLKVMNEAHRNLSNRMKSTLSRMAERLSTQVPTTMVMVTVYTILEALAGSNVSVESEEAEEILKICDTLWSALMPLASGKNIEIQHSFSILLALTYTVQQLHRPATADVFSISRALTALAAIPSLSARQLVHDTLIKSLHKLDVEIKTDMLQQLAPNTSQLDIIERLEFLQSIILISTAKDHSELVPKSSIPSLTIALAQRLPHFGDLTSFNISADILSVLLLKHSRSQSQFAIETTLQSITTICSPTGPKLAQASARHTYARLARIMQHLLTHHRRALRGRFDILTLTMQALLRCLFIPTSRNTKSLRHPPWTSSNASTALPASSAALYTRLLTSLCDPTYASVRSGHTKNSSSYLTDVTKKARDYASRYAPLIVLELCRCLLVGRLAEGAREQLLPGLWAVFEICGREILTAAFEAGGSEERAMLRSLREEWRRDVGGRGGKR